MATQSNAIQTPGNALAAAIARNANNGTAKPAETPKMTETGTPEAVKGVSLQDQVAQLANAVGLLLQAQQAGPAKSAKAPRAAKTPKPPKAEETGPWYARKQYLARTEKGTDKPFYDVDLATIMATDEIAIVRSHQFSACVVFIKGKYKPVYLSETAIKALIGGADTIEAFATANAQYLAQWTADNSKETAE